LRRAAELGRDDADQLTRAGALLFVFGELEDARNLALRSRAGRCGAAAD
jgi:hypothetical protein